MKSVEKIREALLARRDQINQQQYPRVFFAEDEAYLVWHGCCAWAYIHWAQYRSMKTPEDQRELENLVSSFYGRPPMAQVWEHSELLRALLDPEFVAWVDGVLARA